MEAAIIPLLLQYKYWILFPLACIEGPLTAIIVGFLTSLGYFNPLFAFAIFIAGDVIPDGIYYYMGRFGKRSAIVEKWAPKVGVNPSRIGVIERLWRQHPGKTMMVTKFAYGLSTPLLIFAGLVGVPVRTFFMYSIPLSFLQYSVLMTLGYFFGNSYEQVAQWFTSFQLGVAALVMVGGVYFAFTFAMRKWFMKEEKEEDVEMQVEEQQAKKGGTF